MDIRHFMKNHYHNKVTIKKAHPSLTNPEPATLLYTSSDFAFPKNLVDLFQLERIAKCTWRVGRPTVTESWKIPKTWSVFKKWAEQNKIQYTEQGVVEHGGRVYQRALVYREAENQNVEMELYRYSKRHNSVEELKAAFLYGAQNPNIVKEALQDEHIDTDGKELFIKITEPF